MGFSKTLFLLIASRIKCELMIPVSRKNKRRQSMSASNWRNTMAKNTLIKPKRPQPTIWKVQYLLRCNRITQMYRSPSVLVGLNIPVEDRFYKWELIRKAPHDFCIWIWIRVLRAFCRRCGHTQVKWFTVCVSTLLIHMFSILCWLKSKYFYCFKIYQCK